MSSSRPDPAEALGSVSQLPEVAPDQVRFPARTRSPWFILARRVLMAIGVLVATLPFVFTHLTKPELELISTLLGGMLYGWLAWRTRSIVWGALAHTYILTLLMAAAAGAFTAN